MLDDDDDADVLLEAPAMGDVNPKLSQRISGHEMASYDIMILKLDVGALCPLGRLF